jgi:hypothetical protein
MKIVIGKFSSPPFHALSKKELTLILNLVPQEWAKLISSVVLSSKLIKKTKSAKSIEYTASNKKLTIYSRGLVREEIAKQVLLELAMIAEEGNTAVTTEIDEVVKPYMDKFLKAKV